MLNFIKRKLIYMKAQMHLECAAYCALWQEKNMKIELSEEETQKCFEYGKRFWIHMNAYNKLMNKYEKLTRYKAH